MPGDPSTVPNALTDHATVADRTNGMARAIRRVEQRRSHEENGTRDCEINEWSNIPIEGQREDVRG